MIKILCDKLKDNFLFQASLGSKELFHSNMLAWILEQKTNDGEYEVLKYFAEAVAKFQDINASNIKDCEISREENNLDLVVRWTEEENRHFIFIENKMKSIPTLEQLKAYDEKIKKMTSGVVQSNLYVKKLLLTPFSHKHFFQQNSATDNINWENISYAENIIPFLHKIADYAFANRDVEFVVKKYISFLEDQQQLIINCCLDSDSVNFENKKYDFYFSKTINDIRQLRLHDLVLKLAHSKIEVLLRTALKNENIEVNRIETAFTNSTGISSVDIKVSEQHSFSVGIQLQGNQFRYYVQTHMGTDIKTNERLSVELFNKKLWFHDLETMQPLKGKGLRREHYKNLGLADEKGPRSFCEYNKGGFVYLYKELDAEGDVPLISEVISLFVRSLKHFIQIRPQVLEILEKI